MLPLHEKPASQGREGVTRPKEGQVRLGGHALQPASAVTPVTLLKVPGGQSVGELDPDGQNAPWGQTAPVTPSVGVGLVALPKHW